MRKSFIFILFYLFLSIPSLLGQQYYTRNYTINNGLPNNNIREIYKDSRGFLWIGTDAGLAQFDGKNFIVYNTENGLAGNKIWSVTEDSQGDIWIACKDGGISRLNGKEIINYTKTDGLICNQARSLHYSQTFELLFIGTEDGLSVYDHGEFISFHKKLNNVNQKLQITGFFEDKEFIYVFTNGTGLYKYLPDAKSLIRIPSDHPLNSYQVNSAYISSNGDTLINYQRRSLIFNKNSNKNTNDFIGQITDYKEDLNNNVWVSAWSNNYKNAGGLYKIDSTGITNYGKNINLKSNDIFSIEFDSKENLLWIGTKEYGLFLYPLTNFAYYNPDYFNVDELFIKDLYFDNSNNLWIVTKNSIIKRKYDNTFRVFQINKFQETFKEYSNKYLKIKYSYLNDKQGSYQRYQELIESGLYNFPNPYKKISGEIIPAKELYKPLKYDVYINKTLIEFNSVLSDTSGNIYIGSNVGIFKYNKKSQSFNYIDIACNSLNKYFIDQNNKLYASCWADLFIYPNIEENSEYYVFNYYDNRSPINVSDIQSQNKEIWFSTTDHGIFVLKNNAFFSTHEQGNFNNPSFNCVCFDKSGDLIAGGNNGKIYVLNFEKDSIININEISEGHGLMGTSIRFLSSAENILIAGTNKGLNIVNLETLHSDRIDHIETFTEANGFNNYSGNVSIIDKNNNLWIGTNNSLIQIGLDQLQRRRNNHVDFYINSIEINDETADLKNLAETDIWTNIPKSTFKLPYYKNSITFKYEAIHFLDPENVSFSYKLEGYHKNWTKESKERKAVFQNLKPGKYRLRIRIIGPNNYRSNQELSVSFEILSPLWYKWWFIIISLAVLLFLIWLVIFLRTKSIKKKERLKSEITERITEFEMKALRAQMNPHFIFNAINSIQNYMLDNDVDAALNYLSDFAKLIRLTLDNVSKKKVSLEEELNYLKYYLKLEQMRFDKKFETQVILSPEIENMKLMVPSMILQPYVENAIKHGFAFKDEGGKIRLEFQITDDNILKCIIEDNGIGRKKSRELNKDKKGHTPKGTYITNERLALLNQTQERKGYKVEIIDLYDEYNLSSGTRVEIYIPV